MYILLFKVENVRTESTLFVSYAPPHKSVTAKTLSRWMSCILANGGVDTSQWGQHAVRAAGAAHLRKSGLSAREICARADWSLCSSTYKTFYERYI